MMTYRLSPLATSDLEGIWSYTFEEWSLTQADKYHNDIINIIERLAIGELNGRNDETRNGYLKYTAGGHIIFFKQSEDCIDIIRILHQSMDFNQHL